VIPVAGGGSTFGLALKGIPAGDNYTIKLDADQSGTGPCEGSATFDVLADATTAVTTKLRCPGKKSGDGAVEVDGEINVCAVIQSAKATPNANGKTISLSGLGTDEDGKPLAVAYKWKASAGSFAVDDAASSVLKCPGRDVAIKVWLEVSDGDCGESVELEPVKCCNSRCDECNDDGDDGADFKVATAGAGADTGDATSHEGGWFDDSHAGPQPSGDVPNISADGVAGVGGFVVGGSPAPGVPNHGGGPGASGTSGGFGDGRRDGSGDRGPSGTAGYDAWPRPFAAGSGGSAGVRGAVDVAGAGGNAGAFASAAGGGAPNAGAGGTAGFQGVAGAAVSEAGVGGSIAAAAGVGGAAVSEAGVGGSIGAAAGVGGEAAGVGGEAGGGEGGVGGVGGSAGSAGGYGPTAGTGEDNQGEGRRGGRRR
jgi:hypothetical protein